MIAFHIKEEPNLKLSTMFLFESVNKELVPTIKKKLSEIKSKSPLEYDICMDMDANEFLKIYFPE